MTNPPVPATPLDVEACAHLLPIIAAWHQNEMFGMHDCALREFHEEVVKLAGALASALPGMGKDSEPTVAEVIAWMEDRPGCSWMASVADIHEAVRAIRHARAAQPQETSADG